MQNWKLTPDSAHLALLRASEQDSASALLGTTIQGGFTTDAHPKLKFNFTMEIELRGDLDKPIMGTADMALNEIPLKSVTRPNPTVTTVDVNFYNYRTKVQTKTDFGTITATMYDDAADIAHNILQNCMMDISPAASGVNDKALLDNPDLVPFGALSSIGKQDFRNGPIRSIKVHHHFVFRGKPLIGTYTYANPKIQSVDLGDLSMTESDATYCVLTFSYDGYSYEVNDNNLFGEVGDLETVRTGATT